jgi:hypothetical protein
MHLLRKIRLHSLLKNLLPWSLVFESFYPVLPEHLTTQSFVLKKGERKKKKKTKNPKQQCENRKEFLKKKHLKIYRLL